MWFSRFTDRSLLIRENYILHIQHNTLPPHPLLFSDLRDESDLAQSAEIFVVFAESESVYFESVLIIDPLHILLQNLESAYNTHDLFRYFCSMKDRIYTPEEARAHMKQIVVREWVILEKTLRDQKKQNITDIEVH